MTEMLKKPKTRKIYNEDEVGKCGTHAIASNQNYGFNQACRKWEPYHKQEIGKLKERLRIAEDKVELQKKQLFKLGQAVDTLTGKPKGE